VEYEIMIQGSPIVPSFSFNQSVHFRKGASSLLKELDSKKVLVISYPEAMENEAYLKLIANLENNTLLEDRCHTANQKEIERLRNSFSKESIDVIVSVGGGQVIDSCKVLRLLLENPSKNMDTLLEGSLNQRSISLIAVPTTPATGSEANGTAVIKNNSDIKIPYIHRSLLPETAILDSSFLSTLSPEHIFTFIGDVFGHANESLLSKRASFMSKMISNGMISMLREISTDLSENINDERAIDKLLQAAYLGGLVTGSVFVGVCHALAHALEQQNGTPHSVGVVTLTPKCLSWHLQETGEDVYAQLLKDYEELGLSSYRKPEILDEIDVASWLTETLADPSIKTSPIRMKEDNLKELISWVLKR